jgi:hypothetical protein
MIVEKMKTKTLKTLLCMIAVFAAGDAPAAEKWIAAGWANWKDGGGTAHAAVGYSGIRGSDSEASESAMEQCVSAGGVGCKIMGPYSDGCIFVTSGHSGGQASVGAGATEEIAIQNCQKEGSTCKPPIGGCID